MSLNLSWREEEGGEDYRHKRGGRGRGLQTQERRKGGRVTDTREGEGGEGYRHKRGERREGYRHKRGGTLRGRK